MIFLCIFCIGSSGNACNAYRRMILTYVFCIGSDGFDCKVEKDDSGLSWDVVCFTFLLLQLRIYNSHYFRHIIASAEAQNALAARSVSKCQNYSDGKGT